MFWCACVLQPVLGVVHTPATGVTHWAIRGQGAYRREREGADDVPIAAASFHIDDPGLVVVASRAHSSSATAVGSRVFLFVKSYD